MAFRHGPRVKHTSTTTGTGTVTLIAPSSAAFQSYNTAYGAGPVKVPYCIAGTTYFEMGIGTFDNSGPTLTRDVVFSSSNAGSLVSLPAATHDVFVWEPALFAVQAITGTTSLGVADLFGFVQFTGASASTLNLPAVASCLPGTAFPVHNMGTAALTIDPNAAETINGAATLVLLPGECVWVHLRDTATASWSALTNQKRRTRNTQTGTTYTYLITDNGKHVTHSNASSIAGTLPQATATTFVDGFEMLVENVGAGTLTITPTTSTINGAASITLPTGTYAIVTSDGTNYRAVGTFTTGQAKWPLGTLSGLTLARASTTTYTVAAGQAANDDGGTQYDMSLGSTFTKSLSAWAVGSGNGSLDTGAVASTTWYHVHLIRKDSDGTIDVLLSLSPTAPTMPTGYTARRRLGSIKTDGSSNIILFSQDGDEFLWDVATVDVDASNPGTAAVTRTLNVPTGIKTVAIVNVGAFASTNHPIANISALDVSDQAVQTMTTATLTGLGSVTSEGTAGTNGWGFASAHVRTNTSGQVRSRLSPSGAGDRIGIITRGWLDKRGKAA